MHRQELRTLRDFVIGWIVALIFWSIVRNYGVTADVPATPELRDNIRMVIIFGPLAGLLFGITQIKFERYLARRIPLWKLLMFGLALNTLIMALLYVIAY